MTYDLKVMLKYCGRFSHEVLGLCRWFWLVLGASVGGFGLLSGPLWAVLAALGAPRDAKSPPRAAKGTPRVYQEEGPRGVPRAPKSAPRAPPNRPKAPRKPWPMTMTMTTVTTTIAIMIAWGSWTMTHINGDDQ